MPFSDANDPEVKKALRIRALLRAATGFLVVLVVATSLSMNFYQLYRGSKNTSLLKDTHTTTEIIQSCTTPGEKCYNDGLKRTANAIGTINDIIVLAAYCAKQPQNVTLLQIKHCVEVGLH